MNHQEGAPTYSGDGHLAVALRHITKTYGSVVGLRDVSLSISRGQLVGLIGPNGAGKSTLVGCLSGILAATQGEIFLFGLPFDVDSASLKRRIGVMTADLALFDDLRCGEFLTCVAKLYGVSPDTRRDRLADLCSALQLLEVLDRRLSALSSGMRQKVAFAAAVIHRPDILLLDEPFANIDSEAAAMVRGWLNQFVARGGTAIVTSHWLRNLESLCSEIVILNHGEILWQGATAAAEAWRDYKGTTFPSLEDLYLHLVGAEAQPLPWL